MDKSRTFVEKCLFCPYTLNELNMRTITKQEASIKSCLSLKTIERAIKESKIAVDKEGYVIFSSLTDFLDNRKGIKALLKELRKEKLARIKGMIYSWLQINMTYNSNHIEGSKLTKDQTRYIYETKTIGDLDNNKAIYSVDDIIETVNHFRCIDFVIENADKKLTSKFIKKLHLLLKNGVMTDYQKGYPIGEYKKYQNEVGDILTSAPNQVSDDIENLLKEYESQEISFKSIVDFHVKFETIHPFQDGNGRVGRLIILKECLKNGIVPFFIDEEHKFFYYNGLKKYDEDRNVLLDTFRSEQDEFRKKMKLFKIRF